MLGQGYKTFWGIIHSVKVITTLKTCIRLLRKLVEILPKEVTTNGLCNYYDLSYIYRDKKRFSSFWTKALRHQDFLVVFPVFSRLCILCLCGTVNIQRPAIGEIRPTTEQKFFWERLPDYVSHRACLWYFASSTV